MLKLNYLSSHKSLWISYEYPITVVQMRLHLICGRKLLAGKADDDGLATDIAVNEVLIGVMYVYNVRPVFVIN